MMGWQSEGVHYDEGVHERGVGCESPSFTDGMRGGEGTKWGRSGRLMRKERV